MSLSQKLCVWAIGAISVGSLVFLNLDVDCYLKRENVILPAHSPTSLRTTNVAVMDFDFLQRFDLNRTASGIRSSVRCDPSCRARFQCDDKQVKLCYWHQNAQDAQCTCRGEFLFPSEFFRPKPKISPESSESIAILMGGQVRSFTSNLMQEYWRGFFAKLRHSSNASRRVSLFAVLSIKSTNKQNKQNQTGNVGNVTVFQKELLRDLLRKLSVDWHAVFPEECNWTSAAALVRDPALRFLLSPPAHLQGVANKGHANAYRSRAVAFDLMLQLEQERQERFTYVLFLRPDIVYDFNLQMITHCSDAVMCFNDMFAAMHRKLTPWYATHVGTARSLAGAGLTATTVPNYTDKIQSLLGWTVNGGWHDQPMVHLALNGVPFFGQRLDVAKHAISCGGDFTGMFKFNPWIIRDVSRSSSTWSQPRMCSGGNIKQLLKVLHEMGVSRNVSGSLEVCKWFKTRWAWTNVSSYGRVGSMSTYFTRRSSASNSLST